VDAASPTVRRLVTGLYLVMYLGYAGVGVFQFITPSPSVRSEAGPLVYVWAVMLLVGGVMAAVGALRGWWLPELSAQPLLAFPVVLWAFAIGVAGDPPNWSFVFLCVVLVAKSALRTVRLWAMPHGSPSR
jgi:hypothetical protein